jgi:hypothetical protein
VRQVFPSVGQTANRRGVPPWHLRGLALGAGLVLQHRPTTMQPVIRNNRDTGEREMVAMRWGMGWSDFVANPGRTYPLPSQNRDQSEQHGEIRACLMERRPKSLLEQHRNLGCCDCHCYIDQQEFRSQ